MSLQERLQRQGGLTVPISLPKFKGEPDHELNRQIADALDRQTKTFAEIREYLNPKYFCIPAGTPGTVLTDSSGIIDSIFALQNINVTNITLQLDDGVQIPLYLAIGQPPLTSFNLRFFEKIRLITLDQNILICGRIYK